MRVLLFAIATIAVADLSIAADCAYVAQFGLGRVALVNLSTGAVVDTYATQSGPTSIALGLNGRKLAVANFADDSISVIDLPTKTRKTIPILGSEPFAAAASSDGGTAYVTISNALVAVDLASADIVSSAPIDGIPTSVTVLDDPRRGVVALEDRGALAVVTYGGDAPTVEYHDVPGTVILQDVVVDPAGDLIVAGGGDAGSVLVGLSRTTWEATRAINLMTPSLPFAVVVSADGGSAYTAQYEADSVRAVDLASGATIPIQVRRGPVSLALSIDGSELYAACEDASRISVIDTATRQVTRTLGPIAASDIVVVDGVPCGAIAPTPTSTATVTPTATPLPPPTILEIISGSFTRNVRARLDRNHDGRVNAADVIARAME